MKLSIGITFLLLASVDAFVTPGPSRHVVPTRKESPRTATISTPLTTKTLTTTQLQGTREELTTYFLEQVISSGVPALFTIAVIGFAASAFRSSQKRSMSEELGNEGVVSELYEDLYGTSKDDSRNMPAFSKFLGKRNKSPKNTGVPSLEFLKIENRNTKLDSYRYSMTAATQSKALAASQGRSQNFDRALRLSMDSSLSHLSASKKADLLEAEKELLEKGAKVQGVITKLQGQLTKDAIDREMKAIGASPKEMDPVDLEENSDNAKNETSRSFSFSLGKKNDQETWKALSTAQQNLMKMELNFVQDVIQVMGPERANGIRTALLGDVATRGAGGLLTQLQDRPLTTLLQEVEGHERKNLFVTQFPGDPSASQVAELREEVTAIVRSAKPGDEALVVLQTGGGTVTGYGLAAAQLKRFKENGLKLTICVEQVAASGGYMMCCVADKIIASPFAVLGSIGVISDIPNFYDRLREEGIEFQTVTAGKYKRTVTPTKKVTKEDLAKTKEDIEDVLVLFKAFVKENRPSLDIEKVATGETWFGEDALSRGLCDEIKTVDDVVTEYVDAGFNVYDVKYEPPASVESPLAQLLPAGRNRGGNAIQKAIRWMVGAVASEIKSEIDSTMSQSPERKYMMKDDVAERFRMD